MDVIVLSIQKSYWPRGKMLGGSSSMNVMSFVRGSRHDYDQWEHEGLRGWSFADVLPYFIKMRKHEYSRT